MNVPAAKALDKKKLWREIERDERRKKRENSPSSVSSFVGRVRSAKRR